MNDTERELDLQLAEALAENKRLRDLFSAKNDECLRLRHRLEHIYAISHLALQASEGGRASEAPQAHDDTASY